MTDPSRHIFSITPTLTSVYDKPTPPKCHFSLGKFSCFLKSIKYAIFVKNSTANQTFDDSITQTITSSLPMAQNWSDVRGWKLFVHGHFWFSQKRKFTFRETRPLTRESTDKKDRECEVLYWKWKFCVGAEHCACVWSFHLWGWSKIKMRRFRTGEMTLGNVVSRNKKLVLTFVKDSLINFLLNS